jgi:hypothetical protein
MGCLVSRLHDEIARLEGDRDTADARIQPLRTFDDGCTAELTVDEDLAAKYRAADNPSWVPG